MSERPYTGMTDYTGMTEDELAETRGAYMDLVNAPGDRLINGEWAMHEISKIDGALRGF